MNDKKYSVGELANMAQLTIRTLQYYDTIGLLPASRNAESGRRFYRDSDIMRLEQIQFYKLLGFSLDEIKTNLDDPAEIRDLFLKQEYLLIRKIEQLHTSFAAIDASMKVMETGNPPPFSIILQFIRLLPGDDVFEWGPSLVDTEQQANFSKLFKNLEDAQSFYHTLKGLLIDAVVLFHSQVSPAHPQAQELAEKWQEMILTVSDENPALLEDFARIRKISKFGSSTNQELMENATEFIQKAVENLRSRPSA